MILNYNTHNHTHTYTLQHTNNKCHKSIFKNINEHQKVKMMVYQIPYRKWQFLYLTLKHNILR